jgi:hypothetical protein
MAIVIESGFAASGEADEFITSDIIATGNVTWVDSVSGDNSNPGTEGQPLATLAQAITNATASNGDIILIKSGHTETLSSSVSISKAGLKIFGIGEGSEAPRFTVAAAIDGLNITGNNVEVNNLYFPVGTTTANTSRINIDARGVRVKGCTFLCGQYDLSTITITANGIDADLQSNAMTVSADGPDHGVIIENASATGIRIEDCAFNGGTYNWDLGAIYSSVAHLNFVYDSTNLTNDAAIVHTNTGAKGVLSNTDSAEGSSVAV